ncbi:DUF294 nucleotidyltransferase-like domain-containing protein [Fredinandcohnia sp. 179-A 10B2 NHS]|uniref:DUF294 nucleotidyltransferase-like domain-containing protein n=1 Tax=Fredinandcohnia sp. 179-A 10B2 NHS TaxID=3235176 RepID=UPI0039A3E10F
MCENFSTYESIRNWKNSYILQYQTDTDKLNQFHDEVMKHVLCIALKRMAPLKPPCNFTWFITGSGGRFEQGLLSDQDHGIVYVDSSDETQAYFLELGKEISHGMYEVGYPFCEGKVMSSNRIWCKSESEWKEQLTCWMEEGTWEAIRYLQIFYDARCLIGYEQSLHDLKVFIYEHQKNDNKLLQRFMENIMFVKRVIGPFGQIIVEEKGGYEGSIDIKQTAFIPYVNAIRLLAIKEGLLVTSTLERIDTLIEKKGYPSELRKYQDNFLKLLQIRNTSYLSGTSYEESHYLSVKGLEKARKKELKKILKDGKKIHQFVRDCIS